MNSGNHSKLFFIGFGLIVGIIANQFWPDEIVQGVTTDRNDQVAMLTVPTGSQEGDVESVFVLDFETGELTGSTINPQTGRFTRFYRRDIRADFGVRPQAKPRYTLSAGVVPFSTTGQIPAADGVIYISELTSGQVAAYAYPYSPTDKALATLPIGLLDVYAFREVAPAN